MSAQRPVKRVVTSALVLALCLAGCGGGVGSSASAGNSNASEPEAVHRPEGSYAEGASGAQDATSSTDAQDQSKLVRTAYLSLRTREFEKADESLQALVKDHGALVYRNDLTDSGHDDIHRRTRSMSVRIDSSKLDAFLASLSAIDGATVESSSSYVEDRGEAYRDNERRLDLLQREYDYYSKLVEETEDPDAKQAYISRMFELIEEMERYKSQNATIDRDVNLSKVEVQLREDSTVSDLDSSTGMGAEIRDSFSALPGNLLGAFGTFILAIINLIPLVVLAACVGIPIWLVVRYVRRRRKEKAPANAAPQVPTQAPPVPSSDPVPPPPASSHDPALPEPPARDQTDGPAQP